MITIKIIGIGTPKIITDIALKVEQVGYQYCLKSGIV